MNEGAELATAGLVIAFAAVFAGRLAPFHRSPISETDRQRLDRSQNNEPYNRQLAMTRLRLGRADENCAGSSTSGKCTP